MGRTRFPVLAGTVLLALSAVVHAQNAYTNRDASLRAGPDRSYPLVQRIDAGAPVDVQGCLDDWSWCDVITDDTRGWMYAPSLSYVYQGSRVPFYAYAPTFGLPIITFSVGAYWDHYYRGRPWYAQRAEWAGRPVPHRRPPGPAPRANVPPHFASGRGPQTPGGPRPGGFQERGGTAAPERGPRESGARPSTGREVAPREAPARGTPPARGAPSAGERGPQTRGGEHPSTQRPQNERSSSERGNKSNEDKGEPPH